MKELCIGRKLSTLADWIDLRFPNDRDPEVQADLRRWGNQLFGITDEKLTEILNAPAETGWPRCKHGDPLDLMSRSNGTHYLCGTGYCCDYIGGDTPDAALLAFRSANADTKGASHADKE